VVGGVHWFRSELVRKVGNGKETCFWLDIWVGDTSLRERFPRFFSLSTQKECSSFDVGTGPEGRRGWILATLTSCGVVD